MAVPDADADQVLAKSGDASLVFLRVELQGMQMLGPFGEPVETRVESLPATCLVSAASSVRLSAPEDTSSAEMKDASAD